MPARIAVTVQAATRAAPPVAFDVIVPIDLSTIFVASRVMPGVVGVRDQSGPWDRAGATRVVQLTDGSEAPERLTRVNRPHGFSYRVGPFSGPLRLLVSHADGAWEFTPAAGGATSLRWTYTFAALAGRGGLVRVALAPLWRRYAQRALGLAARVADAADTVLATDTADAG
jgi:Polyketide cyclase / dehydrase and lipid transport